MINPNDYSSEDFVVINSLRATILLLEKFGNILDAPKVLKAAILTHNYYANKHDQIKKPRKE